MKLPFTSGGRKKTRKKTSRSRKGKGRRLGGLSWILLLACVILVGGIGMLKWAESQKGQATLLTLGSDRAFAEVQAAVEGVLVQRFPAFRPGAAAMALDHDWPAPGQGPEASVRCRLVALDEDTPLDRVQLEVDRLLRPSGAKVLWGQRVYPADPGADQRRPHEAKDLLRLDVGVAGKPTHTLLLHRAGRTPPVIWGDGGGTSAWDRLVSQADGPVVALVIDDWGNARNETTSALLGLPAPFTMAVLPRLNSSRHFALKATPLVLPGSQESRRAPRPSEGDGDAGRAQRHAAGCFVELKLGRPDTTLPTRRREVILHMPMQPQDYPETNPGADPLLVGMDEQAIEAILDKALANVSEARGMNNHMGSAATSDEATMRALMNVLGRRGLYFVDSLTTARSVAYETARDLGVPALRNRIFLDYDSENEQTIAANLDVAVRSARSRGFAVALGHPHPATARVLARRVPELQKAGVLFVTAGEMLALMADREGRGTP